MSHTRTYRSERSWAGLAFAADSEKSVRPVRVVSGTTTCLGGSNHIFGMKTFALSRGALLIHVPYT